MRSEEVEQIRGEVRDFSNKAGKPSSRVQVVTGYWVVGEMVVTCAVKMSPMIPMAAGGGGGRECNDHNTTNTCTTHSNNTPLYPHNPLISFCVKAAVDLRPVKR